MRGGRLRLHFAHSWMQLRLWFQLGCSPSLLPHRPLLSSKSANQRQCWILSLKWFILPPLPSRERFSLSFLPVTDASEPGFQQFNFSNRLGTGAEIWTWRSGGGSQREVDMDSRCFKLIVLFSFLSPGREETGQWTGVLREP